MNITAPRLDSLVQSSTDRRVAGFDLLRGVCALAVLSYHVLAWNGVAHLYNLGTYGVYIFFILSGASMYVAYAKRFAAGYSPSKFLILRLIRLLPLYLLALAVVMVVKIARRDFALGDFGLAYLNIFFLFGFGNPGATSQVTGGWSLGVEFIFYLIFPVALALISGKHCWRVLAITFITQHVFVNSVFSNDRSLAENWVSYTQFLSFIFYFAAGCAIGRFIERGSSIPLGLGVFLLMLGIIGITSASTSEASLTGIVGVALSLAAVLAVAASSTLRLGKNWSLISELLGKSSYGVYIFHPFIAQGLRATARVVPIQPIAILVLTATISIVLSVMIEVWFEQPIQRFFRNRMNRT